MLKSQRCRESTDGFEWEFEDKSRYVSRERKDFSNGLDASSVRYEHFKHIDLQHDILAGLRGTEKVISIL
jgi:hypothetical protein